jgi:hypothetical protein
MNLKLIKRINRNIEKFYYFIIYYLNNVSFLFIVPRLHLKIPCKRKFLISTLVISDISIFNKIKLL